MFADGSYFTPWSQAIKLRVTMEIHQRCILAFTEVTVPTASSLWDWAPALTGKNLFSVLAFYQCKCIQALSLSVEREVADSNHYLTGAIAFTSAAPVATTYNLPFLTQVMQVTSLNFYSTKHVGEHCKNIYWGLSGNFVPAYSGKKTINSREEI